MGHAGSRGSQDGYFAVVNPYSMGHNRTFAQKAAAEQLLDGSAPVASQRLLDLPDGLGGVHMHAGSELVG
jgi:hypothetical protein